MSIHWPLPSPASGTCLLRGSVHIYTENKLAIQDGLDRDRQAATMSSCTSSISLYEALLGSGLDFSCSSTWKAGHGGMFPGQGRLDEAQALPGQSPP